MDDQFLSDGDIDDGVFFLRPGISDDELDSVLEAMAGDGPRFRNEETGPTAQMLGEMTGDPEWAASFSDQLAQLDHGGRGMLEPEEERILLRSVAAINGDRGFTLEELHAVRVWANGVKISQLLFEMVVDGQLHVGWDPAARGAVFVPADDADA